MDDRTSLIVDAINKLFDKGPGQVAAFVRRLAEESPEARPVLSPEEQAVLGPAYAERFGFDRVLVEDHAKAPAILTELRTEAEALLDGTDDGDSDRSVVLAALKVLAHVQEIVVRELGHDWRGKVRPFGTLARKRGARVGAAWVGDGDVEPITLADAVELLAVDRSQFRREADESRTRAGESVATVRAVRQETADAKRQVDKIRQLLEGSLRPNAESMRWCEECEDGERGILCDEHETDVIEPPLSSDLADEVKRVIELWRDAQNEARSAARGRVSVYVDGQLVTGPPAVPLEGEPEPEPKRIRPAIDTVEWRVVRPRDDSHPQTDVTIARVITPDFAWPYEWRADSDGYFLLSNGIDRVSPPWRFERRKLGWHQGDADSQWQVIAEQQTPGGNE
jgi:hypothetical protein